jgi:hypothetical protein
LAKRHCSNNWPRNLSAHRAIEAGYGLSAWVDNFSVDAMYPFAMELLAS